MCIRPSNFGSLEINDLQAGENAATLALAMGRAEEIGKHYGRRAAHYDQRGRNSILQWMLESGETNDFGFLIVSYFMIEDVSMWFCKKLNFQPKIILEFVEMGFLDDCLFFFLVLRSKCLQDIFANHQK